MKKVKPWHLVVVVLGLLLAITSIPDETGGSWAVPVVVVVASFLMYRRRRLIAELMTRKPMGTV